MTPSSCALEFELTWLDLRATIRNMGLGRFALIALRALLVAMAPGVALATIPPHPPPMMAGPTQPPSSLAVANQYYEGDLDGFRTYLETVRGTDPPLYAVLDPKLKSLEQQQTLGTIVIWSGVATGMGLAAWGISRMVGPDLSECTKLEPLSTERSKCEDEVTSEQSQGLVFLGIGMGVAVVGAVSGLVLKPGRSDLLNLVNDHNRTRPSNPMRLQLGFDPGTQRARAALQLTFDVTQFL